MKNELYNINPADMPVKMYSADDIIQASNDNMCVFLDCGRGEKLPCRVAAHVRGWCTLVTDRGSILQDWAGACTVATDAEYAAAVEARRARR